MRMTIAAALVAALAGNAAAQDARPSPNDPLPATTTTSPPPSKASHDEFCKVAETTYRDIMNLPMKQDKTVTSINFSIYRNEATHRVLELAIAARCNITAYLAMEASHMHQLTLQQQSNTAAK